MVNYSKRRKAARLITIRVKVYKKRLRDYNYRKNIRSTELDAQTYQKIFSSPGKQPARIRLSNGQVITTDDLTSHMMRKTNRVRAPTMIRAPDRYDFVESTWHSYSLLLSKLSLFLIASSGIADLLKPRSYH